MGKTKAELEQEIAEMRERLDEREAAVQDAPGRSEVLPGGGVAVGATLHLRVPTGARSAALDHPPTRRPSPDALASIADAPEGSSFEFNEPISFELADGGYAAVTSFRVLHQPEQGRSVVEVLS